MRSLREINLQNKKVLLRVDFNCPIRKSGQILDDFRIEQELPTIKYLLRKRARVIIISHLGRPQGKKIKSLKLDLIAKRLEKLLGQKVKKIDEILGRRVEQEVEKLKPGEILMLENVRFCPQEEKGDLNFAKNLANLADIFVQDAFSVCHRDHATVTKITKFLPSFAGFLLEKEVKNLNKIRKKPKRPLISIIGGKKEDKFKILNFLAKKSDFVLTGHLIYEGIKKYKININFPQKIIFPLDGIKFKNEILDIGVKTVKFYKEKIMTAKTIFWTGPLGKIEEKRYQKGTLEIAQAIIKSKAFSVVGGGDTVEFLRKFDFTKKFSYVSIGGSALIEYLAGKKLPGIEALK